MCSPVLRTEFHDHLSMIIVSEILLIYAVCSRSSDPFHIVSYYMKWVTTSWTYSMYQVPILPSLSTPDLNPYVATTYVPRNL